jgi:hypothetical protein
MEIRGRWTRSEAIGVYETLPLSFNWRARFPVLLGVWIVAEDGHRSGRGWGNARLWGLVPMGKRTDLEVLVGQLVRGLCELAWLPLFVLVDPSLPWADTGESTFEVRSGARGREVVIHTEIDDQSDVIRSFRPARPGDVPEGYAEARWHCEFSGHREFGDVQTPAAAVARFEKSDGLQRYLRASIASGRV